MNIAGEMEVLKDLEAVSARAAELIADRIRGGTVPFRLALSGGSTPRGCYRHLAHLHQVPWDRVEIYLGDERFVPHDHPESNYRMIRETLLSGTEVNPRGMFAVPGDGDAERAAQTYEEILRQQYGSSRLLPQQPLFDLQLLGLGEDGHTASLLPGQPVLEEHAHWVSVVPDGRPEPRITLTYPALESSRLTVFLVAGAAKRQMLARARAGDRTIPAGRLKPQGAVIWLVDRAAAGTDAD
ncbi:MAG: 6-phosphogluconolactonase [Alphaproteobacteria bacterium]|nr:6-phosphogluconolactonase [Alphaproteobacteria bacterium]